jgi:hypothetical protein
MSLHGPVTFVIGTGRGRSVSLMRRHDDLGSLKRVWSSVGSANTLIEQHRVDIASLWLDERCRMERNTHA